MPFHCRVDDGVLIIRGLGIIKMADVAHLANEEERYFADPGCRGLLLCDHSELRVISPDGADALVEQMRVDNPRVVRSAFVVGDGTSALQLGRMIRDAGSTDKRRTFTSAEQALAWLQGPD